MIDETNLEVKFMEKLDISDHIPVRVKIKHENWQWRELDVHRFTKNKKFMK